MTGKCFHQGGVFISHRWLKGHARHPTLRTLPCGSQSAKLGGQGPGNSPGHRHSSRLRICKGQAQMLCGAFPAPCPGPHHLSIQLACAHSFCCRSLLVTQQHPGMPCTDRCAGGVFACLSPHSLIRGAVLSAHTGQLNPERF